MRDRLFAVLLAVGLVGPGGALAAPPDDHILPLGQYTSDKGRNLAAKYMSTLEALDADIYHCMPWLDVPRHTIGFFRPKHIPRDDRYFSLRIYVEQDPSPQFMALRFEERAAAMFSRYVGPMLRRMTANPALMADPSVDGFTVIISWLKEVAPTGARPVQETIAVFVEKAAAADYLTGRARIGDVAGRAAVLGFDGEKPLGPQRVQAWDDNFVSTFQVANYQPAAGVTCR